MDDESKQINALLANESFLKYCAGDENERLYWELKLKDDIELRKNAKHARYLYELVKAEMDDVPIAVEQFRNSLQQHILAGKAEIINQPTGLILPMIRRNWMVAAAAITFLVGAFGYFVYVNKNLKEFSADEKKVLPFEKLVVPGGDKAVLTLADGSQITLDSANNGALSNQGGATVIKMNNGQLAYNKANQTSNEIQYNTVSTPKGGQFNITLSDGTSIWLNAASSIHFPAVFTGKERAVEITGEAYMEVAHNAAMPFKVKVNGMEISVLGTRFNVNAYDNEASIKTTLLEGSVKLMNGTSSGILKPGQQASLNNKGIFSISNDVEVDEVIAWKKGLFQFSDQSIESIMRQISRWYNVEVDYIGGLSEETFSGIVSRDSDITKVLKIMEVGGIKFDLDQKGRKITVFK